MTFDTRSEREILATRGISDFRFFCRDILGLANPANPKAGWWDESVHGPLCDWLQGELTDWQIARACGIKERRYIAAVVPRACAKSQIITIAAPMWLQLRMPHLSGYIGNESLDLASDFLAGIKAHYTNDAEWALFKRLYGDWKHDAPLWNKEAIEHAARNSSSKDPSFGIFSPNSGLTGRHPDFIIMDDLVSYDALARKSDWFSYAYAAMTDLIPVVEPNGLIILVGTRYGDGDPFGRSFRTDGILSLNGHKHNPTYAPTPNGLWRVYFLDGKNPDGTPAIPTCWSASEMERLAAKDPVKFAAQVRNDPRAHGLNTITEDQFNSLCISEDALPKSVSISIHLDTAFKHESRKLNDSETVAIVAAHPHDGSGKVFIVEVHHSHRWRAEMLGECLVGVVKRHRALGRQIIGITDERLPTGKDGLFATWLSNYFVDNAVTDMPTVININRGNGETKDVRISEAIAYVVRGHVQFIQTMPGLADLRDQLISHPYSARKDIADAFADIFHPYFYQQRLPAAIKEPYAPGGYERNLKGYGFQYDIMNDEEIGRPPLGGSGRRPPAR